MLKAFYSKRTLIFKQPSATSRGILTEKEVFYLVLADNENPSKKGIGEIAPVPGLSQDAVPGLEEKIRIIVSKINYNEEISDGDFTGFPAVKFGYETALAGLKCESPFLLFHTEFTKGKTGIPINGLVWMGTKDFMLKQVSEKIAAGFTCLKLKIGAIDFESELGILRFIREQFPANQLEIRVDANGAFSPENAVQKLIQLAKFDLHSIEQPIRQGQFSEMKKLCENSPVPVALDEELIGISKKEEKEKLLDFIRPDYIVLKPTLLGGIKESEEWISLAQKYGIGWWVTSALESNIGLNAIAQWVSSLKTNNLQGLGTGALFVNNVESPLYVSKGFLWYDPLKLWDFKSI